MNRDIYSKLITKLRSIGTIVSSLQNVTAITLAENLAPVAENMELHSCNYIFKIGSLVVYHIAITLKGTSEVPFAKNTWLDVLNIPEGFYMATADQVPASNLSTALTNATAYYDNVNHKLQLRLENDISASQTYEFLMVGRIAT